MSKRGWAACVLLATVFADTGCVSCGHKCAQKAWQNGAECDIPTPCRARVHVFMMHGLTPSTDGGLNALRLKLAESGFAKVGLGEMYGAAWVKSEIECIRFNDPDARFVLLGYDCGAVTATSLARDLSATGVPVDAVVLLDPVGGRAEPCGARTLVITSARAVVSSPDSERLIVPDASHFGLPAHPVTVSTVTALLKEIAWQNCTPPVELEPEWTYPHAPEHQPAVRRPLPAEWNFLADHPGPTLPIGAQTVAKPAPATVAAKR